MMPVAASSIQFGGGEHAIYDGDLKRQRPAVCQPCVARTVLIVGWLGGARGALRLLPGRRALPGSRGLRAGESPVSSWRW